MEQLTTSPKSDHRVVLVRCDDYDSIPDALQRGIKLLGGIEKFCSPGEKLLLKPNLLHGEKPERGVTTHPKFFEAVARFFAEGGASLAYGDSPGFGSPQSAVQSTGLSDVADKLGIELADFVNGQDVQNPQGRLIKLFNLAKGLSGCDGLINLPKLKTHGLTRMTGAVKNLFGCLPGVQKAGFHARLENETLFGHMLVDLAELIAPRLHIMDGIMGMEGNGPSNGDLRKVGVILISTNPYALDHCVAKIMDLDPFLVPTLREARDRKLYQPDGIITLGDPLEAFILKDFKVNRSKVSPTGPRGIYMDILKHLITPRPVIDVDLCTACGQCVSICPVKPKAIRFTDGRNEPPQYHYPDCIRCYCCQEICPYGAIHIFKPFVSRILSKINI